MIIRSIEEKDLQALLAIEYQSMSQPWTAGQLHAEIRAVNGVGLLAERKREICGYIFFRVCLPESELLHLVVAKASRMQGVGSILLQEGLVCLAAQGCISCFLEVRCSNHRALRLYHRVGFQKTGVRKKYYSQPVEDALLLCTDLTVIKGERI